MTSMMTDELIFRSDALKALSHGEGCGNICSRAIRRIPAVDAAPVGHAHWIEYYTDIMCSHCHATYKDEIIDTYQDSVDHRRYVGLEYCPHCGSIMDGGEDDADGETPLSAEWKNELRPVQADIDDAYYEYGRKHQEGER